MDSNGLLTRIKNWALAPLTTQMDLLDVALTTILVTTVVVAWLFVLNHVIAE